MHTLTVKFMLLAVVIALMGCSDSPAAIRDGYCKHNNDLVSQYTYVQVDGLPGVYDEDCKFIPFN